MAKTLTFYSNPEVGAVHMPEQAYVFIGARIDIEASQASGKNIFAFSHDPVNIPADHKHVAYFASLCRHGDIFAGDQETVDFCQGGTIADEFRMKAAAEAAAALAKEKIAAKKARDDAEKAAKEEAEKAAKASFEARKKAFDAEVAARKKARDEEAAAAKAPKTEATKPQ